MKGVLAPGRALGPQELLFADLIRRCNGGIQLSTMVEFERPADEAAVRDALAAVHRRHPMLRARIEDGETPWWRCDVPFGRIEVRSLPIGPDFDPEAFYAREAETVLDLERVSWRAVLLTNEGGAVAWLCLTTNHGAIDGRSALVVLNDIDRYLADPGALGSNSLPMTLAAEQGLAAAGHDGDIGIFSDWPDQASWTVECPAAAAERTPHVLFRLLPRDKLGVLHRRLHAQGIHLAAGFAAAAVRAAEGLPGAGEWVGIIAPTDVRADCQPAIPADAVGEYVAAMRLLVEPTQRTLNLLDLARLLGRQFHDNRPPALRMAPDVPVPETRRQVDAMAAASDRFASGICVTDVGDLDTLSGRSVGFGRVLTMPSQNHGVHPVLIAIVTTRAGVCLSIGYDQPLRSEQAARAFADRYCEALIDLAG